MKCSLVLTYLLVCLLAIAGHAQWIKQNVNTTAGLRGLSVVNDKIVWASGTGGTVIQTINGGKLWKVITVPGAEKLDFRDIEAFDSKTAYILSIGNGESSRIYKTIDGGKTWKLQFKNTDEKAFFDAIACWDERNCIAMSDPVNGKFLLLRNYWGDTWQAVEPSDAMARLGQAAFAASGTCLITVGPHHQAFLVTGGTAAEVMFTLNNGVHWDIYATQIPGGSSGSGIFSIAMFDDQTGVIVGGNYEKPDEHTNNLAFTSDGGKTWVPGTGLNGYRSGVKYVNKSILVAVGTNGSDISYDGGKTWSVLDKENYNSVQSKGLSSTWAVGPKGRVAFCPILQLQKNSRK